MSGNTIISNNAGWTGMEKHACKLEKQALQDSNIEENGTKKYENVPYCMVVRNLLDGIEDYSYGIGKATCQKIEEEFLGDKREDILPEKDYRPAHKQVKQDVQKTVSPPEGNGKDNPSQGK